MFPDVFLGVFFSHPLFNIGSSQPLLCLATCCACARADFSIFTAQPYSILFKKTSFSTFFSSCDFVERVNKCFFHVSASIPSHWHVLCSGIHAFVRISVCAFIQSHNAGFLCEKGGSTLLSLPLPQPPIRVHPYEWVYYTRSQCPWGKKPHFLIRSWTDIPFFCTARNTILCDVNNQRLFQGSPFFFLFTGCHWSFLFIILDFSANFFPTLALFSALFAFSLLLLLLRCLLWTAGATQNIALPQVSSRFNISCQRRIGLSPVSAFF